MVYYISVFVIFVLSYLFGDLSSHWDCGMKTNTLYRLQYIILFLDMICLQLLTSVLQFSMIQKTIFLVVSNLNIKKTIFFKNMLL